MYKNVAAALMCGFFVLGPQTLAAEPHNWIQQVLDSVSFAKKITKDNHAESFTKDISGTGGKPGPGDTGEDKGTSGDSGSFTRDISGTGG